MKPIRLAMIGSGDISNRFFEQAAKLEQVQFVATSARHLENAQKKADKYGVPRAYDDYRQMLEREELDGVVVTTPHSAHAEAVLAALGRGLHVLNEKPMATSFDDCRRMVELAEMKQTVFMSLPFDLNPALLKATEFVKEEWIGKITGAEAQLSIPGPPRDNWYYDRSIAHGGAMLDCMVYPVSRLITLLGPAKSVVAEINTLIPKRIVGGGKHVDSTVDDNATLIVEFAGGQHAVLRTLWGISFAQNNTIIYGRKGSVALNDSGLPLVIQSPVRAVPNAEPVEWRGQQNCYAIRELPGLKPEENILGHFVGCLRSGRQPKASARQQLHVHEILFGAYQAAETGKRYELSTTFTPWNELEPSIFDTRSDYI